MSEFALSYREVTPDQTVPEKWREFTLNTGGTQSILQDIKVPERANGYCYKDASKYYTRNRFIYWRINNDTLELSEQSLDVNLTGNRVRFKFTDTPILDGISINEYFGSVVILVPTVCSVHKLSFSHPDRINKKDEILGAHPNLSVPSIFNGISQSSLSDPTSFSVVTNPYVTGSTLPNVAASYLDIAQEEAVFVYGYSGGELLCVKQSFTGQISTLELKQETIVPRFLSGIAGALRNKLNDGHLPVSLVLHSFGLDIYAITLCRDANLRIWSCSKGQFVGIHDVISESADVSRHLVQGVRSHIIRKSVDAAESELILAVYLNFTPESQFHVLRPSVVNGNFIVNRLCVLYSSEQDLVDFSLDVKRIWTVWRSLEGDFNVQTCCLDCQIRSDWMPVILNGPLDSESAINDDGVDPKHAYASFIFYPGRFSLSVITKALSIYRKTAALSDVNVSASVLKQHVCLAVEMEIQMEVQDYEISDEDYVEISTRCWSRFFSCVIQYHAASIKPLGLLILPSVSGVSLLKKSTYSLFRPMDPLEHIFMLPDTSTPEQFRNFTHLQISQDGETCSDLITLLSLLHDLDDQLKDVTKRNVDREMTQLKPPDRIISEMVIDLMAGSEETMLNASFLWQFMHKLSDCVDLYKSMHLLLEMLRLDEITEDFAQSSSALEQLYCSEAGVTFVAQSLKQVASVRYAICRSLLVLQNVLLERRELDWGVLEAIRSVCMPDTVVFMQAYFVIVWLGDQVTISSGVSESVLQRLSPLSLPPVFTPQHTCTQPVSLLHLFAASTGGWSARGALSRQPIDEDALPNWHCSLLGTLRCLGQVVWPVSGTPVMTEWMLASGQFLLLQQFVRLVNGWCEWNACSRNFLLAAALLTNGEFYKAQDLFLKSAKGLFSETYLANKLGCSDGLSESQILVDYYLKVIQLFELHGSKDCAINVARTALSVADSKDVNTATLHSVMFVHRLHLGHYEEAFDSLVANPDKARREDNLRDLVKVLLENRMLDQLLAFSYGDMAEIFCNMIMARARACDAVYNMFYDFLYSFEVKRSNLRLAATAMYEQAYRLSQHSTTAALERQVKCYLACINALQLVNEEDKWVLRPVDQGEEVETLRFPVKAGLDQQLPQHRMVKEVKAMDLSQIWREFMLSKARLRLARYNSSTMTNHFNAPSELIAISTNVGIFKYALELCQTFKVPYDSVFEAITKTCVTLASNDNPEAWNWLVENDLADLSIVDSSPTTVCWHLLQHFLDTYEEDKMTVLHKVVCQKLVLMGADIPYWLLASYKKRNASELLRLLLRNGRLAEASCLAGQYMSAALGMGKEYFGLDQPLVVSAPSLCLPLNAVELLIYELGETSKVDRSFEKDYSELKELFCKYIQTCARVSADKIKMAAAAAAT